jgi:DNA-binding NarL/FixJ family response regulator
MPIRVAIVEDNHSIRESMALILDGSPGIRCCGAWRNAEEALSHLPQERADVVLMDINLPGQSGIECVRRLKGLLPNLQIIMLTIEDDSHKVFESLKAGASGYLIKNLPPVQILAAVEEVHRGGSPMSSQIARLLVQQFQKSGRDVTTGPQLTPREAEVLGLAAKGYRSKEIAEALSLSPQTVQTHFRNTYEKLHVRSRAGAVARFLERS